MPIMQDHEQGYCEDCLHVYPGGEHEIRTSHGTRRILGRCEKLEEALRGAGIEGISAEVWDQMLCKVRLPVSLGSDLLYAYERKVEPDGGSS